MYGAQFPTAYQDWCAHVRDCSPKSSSGTRLKPLLSHALIARVDNQATHVTSSPPFRPGGISHPAPTPMRSHAPHARAHNQSSISLARRFVLLLLVNNIEFIMADPHANRFLGWRPQAAVSDREQQAPVQQTHLSGDLNLRGAVHETPKMDHVLTHHDRKADDALATATSVPRPSEKRVLTQSTTSPHDRKAEEAPATRATVARPSSKKRPLDQSTTRPGYNRHLRGLPQDWCDWCLASHPFKDETRSYHIRPSRGNNAMHDAITSGAIPKVDPWAANMAAVQAARAIIEASKAPKPPKPARDAASMFMVDVPDEVMAIIKSRDSVADKMTAYFAHRRIEDDKIKVEDDEIRAREAAEFARVVATANLLTGPASLKRRPENAAREGRQQQPGNNNTRPRKLPRAANASSATGHASYTPPTFQQSRYQSIAAPSAPVSSNEAQRVQQPLQKATASSDASSKKDAEPSDAPAAKAGAATTPTAWKVGRSAPEVKGKPR